MIPGQIYTVGHDGHDTDPGFSEQIERLMSPYDAGVYWLKIRIDHVLTECRTQRVQKTNYSVGPGGDGPHYAIRVIKGHPALDFDSYVAGALACRDGESPLDFEINTPHGLAGAIGWGMWYEGNVFVFSRPPATDWTDEHIESMRQEAHGIQQDYENCKDGLYQFEPCNPVVGINYGGKIIQPRAHNQTGKPFAVPEHRAGDEQEFEIAPGVKIVMCWIPPGEFLMGSQQHEVGAQTNEKQHRVTITYGFWLGKYEVTQAQWEAVMVRNPSHFKGSNLPVEWVSWDAIAGPGGFMEKVNRFAAAGGIFSLPTEAQWEYACRAGTVSSLNNGKNLTIRFGPCPNIDEVAWYRENSDCKTHPVGEKKANAWGLHDMHGNVWEWCSDRSGDYPTGPVADPQGPSTGANRILRGGRWFTDAAYCRAAYRKDSRPTNGRHGFGFRVTRSSVSLCDQKCDDVEAYVVDDGKLYSPTPTESSIIVQSPISLVGLPDCATAALPGISQPLAHIPKSKALVVPEYRAGEEQEFEIAPGAKIVMCWIPPGEFLMGSPEDEVGRYDNETQHRVTITRGFWLGKYPVTQAQWEVVMKYNPSEFEGSNLPVEWVSWDTISEPGGFMEWVNRFAAEGGTFSLPTEAQWEYACRANTVTALNNGKNLTSEDSACPNLDELAWYDENSGSKRHPVGQKEANGWGLHDMHGNVWEWCADWYHDYTDGVQVDPQRSISGTTRVIRGGSWGNNAGTCRVAVRGVVCPDIPYDYVGFRLARSQGPQ